MRIVFIGRTGTELTHIEGTPRKNFRWVNHFAPAVAAGNSGNGKDRLQRMIACRQSSSVMPAHTPGLLAAQNRGRQVDDLLRRICVTPFVFWFAHGFHRAPSPRVPWHQTASCRSVVRRATRPRRRCRCACQCPTHSSRPAQDSCKPACR